MAGSLQVLRRTLPTVPWFLQGQRLAHTLQCQLPGLDLTQHRRPFHRSHSAIRILDHYGTVMPRPRLADQRRALHRWPVLREPTGGRESEFSQILKSGQAEQRRTLRTSHLLERKQQDEDNREIVTQDHFGSAKEKNKNTYLDFIRMFNERSVHQVGHVEFIHTALKHMEMFGVHKDLEVYKSLIDVFPKGKMIPTNRYQAEFQHYPKQQQCAIDLLEQMEDNGVIPDTDMEAMLLNVFGKYGYPLRKYWRMMYWMPKFKNLSPWPVPNPPPDDALELAKLALQRIGSVDLLMALEVFQAADLPDSLDKTWIVSAQSPAQQELLAKQPVDQAIYVEGAFRVWLRGAAVNYFILRAEPTPITPPRPLEESDDVSNLRTPFDDTVPRSAVAPVRSVHEQVEGTILALAATGTSSRDSLLSWIRFLQHTNPALGSIPVLFSLTSPFGHVVPVVDAEEQTNSPSAV